MKFSSIFCFYKLYLVCMNVCVYTHMSCILFLFFTVVGYAYIYVHSCHRVMFGTTATVSSSFCTYSTFLKCWQPKDDRLDCGTAFACTFVKQWVQNVRVYWPTILTMTRLLYYQFGHPVHQDPFFCKGNGTKKF